MTSHWLSLQTSDLELKDCTVSAAGPGGVGMWRPEVDLRLPEAVRDEPESCLPERDLPRAPTFVPPRLRRASGSHGAKMLLREMKRVAQLTMQVRDPTPMATSHSCQFCGLTLKKPPISCMMMT